MAQAPYLSTQKQYKGKYIVKDLFTKDMVSKSTGDDLFSMVETSPNGRDGIFDTRKEALEAIEERKLETGRGLSSKEINKKYSKYIKAEGFNKWEETDDAAKKRIKQAYRYDKGLGYQKVGRTKINPKTVNLLEKKKPINPRTGLPYTQEEFVNLTRGQKTKLSLRMRDKKKPATYDKRFGYDYGKKDNKLLNYMKEAAKQQEKLPVKDRTFINVFEQDGKKFVGVKDVKANTLYTHVDYDLSKKGAKKGTVITAHPQVANPDSEFNVYRNAAEKFKYNSPDKLLKSYFAKYERVPTYNEIYNFFTMDRSAPLKTISKNNALTLQHLDSVAKNPTSNFQLLTGLKNTEANKIINKLRRGEITETKANYDLNKIGAGQEGYGVPKEKMTPGKGMGVAKREAVKLFKDAIKVNPNVPQDMAARLMINEISKLKPGTKAFKTICTITKAEGGSVDACVERVAQEPEKFANKFKSLTAESGPLAKVKNAALGFLKSPGLRTFGIAGTVGAVGAQVVKEFRNDDPTSYLSNEDQQKSMLVSMATDPITTEFDRPAILDYQLPALGATVAGATALGAPSTIKASRSRALGVEKKGLTRTGARVLGRGLGLAATPAALLPFAAADLAGQIAEGDSAVDIATDPINYLAPIFADKTDKITRGLNPTLRKLSRLNLGKAALRGISRGGIAGLGLSLGIEGLRLLDD
jgi:hypothetical protein